MRRRSTLPVAFVLAVGSLAGCGSHASKSADSSSPSASTTSTPKATITDSGGSSPGSDRGSASGSASESPYGSAGASGFPHDRTEATSLHTAVLAHSAARTPEERAAVDAWMAFWQGAADTYYFYRPTQQFTSVAGGTAKTEVLGYMEGKKAKHQRVVGWARDNVLGVQVTGDTAKIRDCTENYTFTVDQEAEPLTEPPPYYATTGTLKKVDGRWMVIAEDSRKANKSCLG